MKLIYLTKGQVTKVSDRDSEWLNQWKWHARKNSYGGYYAVRDQRKNGVCKTYRMHRVILGLDIDNPHQGDHKNHDTLDNQRHNLRVATCSENGRNKRIKHHNKTGYKGVSTHRNKFRASMWINKKNIKFGLFTDPIQAAKMYDFWARDMYDEFANCNFKGERIVFR